MSDFQEPITDKMLEKLRALQNLAERGGTEHEAAAAAAKVAELSMRHGITMAEIAMAQGEELKGYGHTVHDTDPKFERWRMNLLNTIAKAHSCRLVVLSQDKRGPKYDVVGYRDHVDSTLKLYNGLAPLLRQMATLRYAMWKLEQADGTRRSTFYRSYLEGAVDTIAFRFSQMRTEVTQELGSKALIVLTNKTNETVDKLYGQLGQVRSTRGGGHRGARERGRSDGRDVQLQSALRNATRNLAGPK